MQRKCRRKVMAMVMAVAMASSAAGNFSVPGTVYAAQAKEAKLEFPAKYTQDLVQPVKDDVKVNKKVEALVRTMTENEKWSFLGGRGTGQEGNAGDLLGVARLGVPRIKMYDGPAGLLFTEETTNPPQEQLLAATWDEAMADLYGQVYSQENLAMGGTMMLSAQFDIQRHPYWMRTKDQMGEDPYLLASLADDMTAGMQSKGGIAVLKHYAVASDDGDLIMKYNQNVDEQTLHELYLPGFEAAIKNGGALGVMSGYNRTNGERSSQNTYLLQDVLRDMWGYEYFTITDWGGNHTFTLDDGTDIEMPSTSYNSKKYADQLVEKTAQNVTGIDPYTREEMDALIDDALRHILKAYGKAGYLTLVQVDKTTGKAKEGTVAGGATVISGVTRADGTKEDVTVIDVAADSESLAALHSDSDAKVQEVAEAGGVLLKNEGNTLPLQKDKSVAVVGLNGMYLISGTGGERSYGTVSSMTSPYEGLADILGEDKVTGAVYNDMVGTIIPKENLYTTYDGDTHGAVRTYGTGESADSGEVYQGQYHSNSVPATTMKDPDGKDLPVGKIAATDETIDFNTNSKTYVNADKGAGLDIEKAGNAFPYGGDKTAYSGRPAYTWTTYLEAEEAGEYTIILQSMGAQAAMNVYSVDLTAKDPAGKNADPKDTTMKEVLKSMGSASGASANQGTMWYSSTVPSETGENLSSVTVNLEAGKRYKIGIASANTLDGKDMQVGLAWITPSQKQKNVTDAINAAKAADTTVIFAYAGTSSLGSTREATTLKLDAAQQKMINDAAKAAHDNNHKAVVVLNNSAAIVMEDWINNVDAILEMYYPGQRGGVATANLLTGDVNPSGKLAFTIPKKDTDTFLTYSDEAFNSYKTKRTEGFTDENDGLTFDSPGGGMGGGPGGGPGGPGGGDEGGGMGGFPGFGGGDMGASYDMDYSEGIFTGYRWYDKENVEPQYDFGYGLSYTTFAYSDMKVVPSRKTGEEVGYDVTFTVKNTGKVAGSEVAQVYLGEADVPDGVQMAKYQLAGYKKVKDLDPGEARTVTVHVSERSLSYWDAAQETLNANSDGTKDKWTVAEGERTIYVGAASDDFKLNETVDVRTVSEEKIQEAEKQLEDAKAAEVTAKDALAQANKDKEAADAAKQEAQDALAQANKDKDAADAAKQEAQDALAQANKDKDAADAAKQEAQDALAQANKDKDAADAAKQEAQDKLAQADKDKEAAETAKTEALNMLEQAKAALKAAQDTVAQLKAQQGQGNSSAQISVGKVKQNKPASKKKKQLQVSWKAEAGASGYEVQYALKKNMKNAVTKTVKGNKTKLTVKKLTKGKKYFVRVRAYKNVGDMTVYGAYSNVGSVKVR